jgi:hypothetical protein
MRPIALILVILLCARIGVPCPTLHIRPHVDRLHTPPQKVLPISLRHRQLIQQQIHIPPSQPDAWLPPACVASASRSVRKAPADLPRACALHDLSAPIRC